MMRLLLVVALALVSIDGFAQPITYDWARSMGGKNNYDGSQGLAKDASGNIYITGDFSGTRDFGSYTLTATGFNEVFVAKYSSSGTCLWAIKGGASFSTAYAGKVSVNGNTVYVTGNFSNVLDFGGVAVLSSGNKDMFLASLDATTGAANWLSIGGSAYDDIGINVVASSGAGAYVCGTFVSTATFGAYTVSSSSIIDADMFVAKYDAAGNCVWVKRFGSTGTDKAMAVKELPTSEILITGSFEQSVVFGPSVTLTSSGYADYFLAKLDNAGTLIWAVKGGGDNNDIGHAISVDPAGFIYTTGFIADTSTFGTVVVNNSQNINVIIAKHNFLGVCQWVKHGGNILDDMGLDIVADYNGSTYFVGYLSGNSSFGGTLVTGVQANDALIGKYDNAGTLRWITKVGGSSNDQAKAVLLDVSGYCIVSGDYSNTAIFGSTTLSIGSGQVGTFLTRMGGGTVGINEISEFPYTFYPNPTRDFINLNLNKIKDLVFTVDIISMDGKIILTKQLGQQDAVADYKINLSGIAAGNYVISVNTSNGDFTTPFILNK